MYNFHNDLYMHACSLYNFHNDLYMSFLYFLSVCALLHVLPRSIYELAKGHGYTYTYEVSLRK